MPLFFGTDYDVELIVSTSNNLDMRALRCAYGAVVAYPIVCLRGGTGQIPSRHSRGSCQGKVEGCIQSLSRQRNIIKISGVGTRPFSRICALERRSTCTILALVPIGCRKSMSIDGHSVLRCPSEFPRLIKHLPLAIKVLNERDPQQRGAPGQINSKTGAQGRRWTPKSSRVLACAGLAVLCTTNAPRNCENDIIKYAAHLV